MTQENISMALDIAFCLYLVFLYMKARCLTDYARLTCLTVLVFYIEYLINNAGV